MSAKRDRIRLKRLEDICRRLEAENGIENLATSSSDTKVVPQQSQNETVFDQNGIGNEPERTKEAADAVPKRQLQQDQQLYASYIAKAHRSLEAAAHEPDQVERREGLKRINDMKEAKQQALSPTVGLINNNLYKSWCTEKQWCLRTSKTIQEGEQICLYPGEKINKAELERRRKLGMIDEDRLLDVGKGLYYDCNKNTIGMGKLMNHVCKHLANVSLKLLNSIPVFIASKEIKYGEELCWNYNQNKNFTKGVEWSKCYCRKAPPKQCYLFCICPEKVKTVIKFANVNPEEVLKRAMHGKLQLNKYTLARAPKHLGMGVYIDEAPARGDCFFWAVLMAILGPQLPLERAWTEEEFSRMYHQQFAIRRLVARENLRLFYHEWTDAEKLRRQHVMSEYLLRYGSLEAYVAIMFEPAEGSERGWADAAVEGPIIAVIFQRPLIVYTPNEERIVVYFPNTLDQMWGRIHHPSELRKRPKYPADPIVIQHKWCHFQPVFLDISNSSAAPSLAFLDKVPMDLWTASSDTPPKRTKNCDDDKENSMLEAKASLEKQIFKTMSKGEKIATKDKQILRLQQERRTHNKANNKVENWLARNQN